METTPNTTGITETHETSHHVTSLTARQRMAAMLLAEGVTLKDIAKQLKIRRETISRWRKQPVFLAEYEWAIEENKKLYIKTREEMRDNLQHEVTDLVNKAIDAINYQIDQGYDTFAERSKLAFDILKFLKADQLFTPTASPENKR